MSEMNNETSMQEEGRSKRGRPKKAESITVIAQTRIGVADPNSTRGTNRRITVGTGVRMVEKGEEVEIDIETAKKLQENGAVKIKL